MLERSFTNILPYAQELAEKGIVLSPIPSSILSELCSHSLPLDYAPQTGVTDGDLSAFAGSLVMASAGVDGGRWGNTFDAAADELSKTVANHISYIRNIVVPSMEEFTKEAQCHLQELGNSSPASELEIVKISLPEFATEEAFLALLENFKGRSVVPPNSWGLNFEFNSIPEDFVTVATTGSARIDAMIAAWAKTTDINYLQSVWHTFFASSRLGQGFNKHLSDDDMSSPDLGVRLNVSLAYFLIANHYYTHLPDAVVNEDVAATQRRIYDHLSYAATTLLGSLLSYEQNNKADILVYHADIFHKKVSVGADVYDRWLATGGKAEYILGLLVEGHQYHTVADVDANAEKLQRAWDNYTRVYVETVELKKASSMRNFYLALFNTFLSTEHQDVMEKMYLSSHPNYHEKSPQKAADLLDALNKTSVANPHYVAKLLIAGIKFGFTEAFTFLENMEQVQHQNPNASADEAAMMATVDYVVEYILSQIRATK